jgi:hypothetical protein
LSEGEQTKDSYRYGVPGDRFYALSEYELAYQRVVELASDAIELSENMHQFVRMETSRHGGAARTLLEPGKYEDRPMKEYSTSLSMPIDEIRQGDVEAEIAMLVDSARKRLEQWAPELFKALQESAPASGLVSDGDQQSNVDRLYDGLSRMDIPFDDDGKPILKVAAHPDAVEKMARMFQEAEQQPRFEELLNRKREEFCAKKRHRRIS